MEFFPMKINEALMKKQEDYKGSWIKKYFKMGFLVKHNKSVAKRLLGEMQNERRREISGKNKPRDSGFHLLC